jgi:hypothetical protein
LPNSGCVEFVDQDSINDSLPYFVVVPGLRFDIFWGRTERFAATDTWQHIRRREPPSTVSAEMLSNERVGFESAYAARASRTSDKEPFADDKILVSFWRVFFSIHA